MKTIICPADIPDRRGGARRRPVRSSPATTGAERKRAHRARTRADRQRYVAVLDMETDPFDRVKETYVLPFLAVLYSDEFEPVIIWENDHDKLCARIISAIEALPNRYTIYAHNGGKFDYLFLVSRLRGDVKFKGRGIMCARVGAHEIRDSFHIIPERLAAFQKDAFDYTTLQKDKRENFKAEIIRYCLNDCRYLLDIVKTFVGQFGLKLSIGQASMAGIRQHYTVEKFSAGWDKYVREYYFGGRVQCLAPGGEYRGDYKLIDVNSLYPFVMATMQHPIGGFHDYEIRKGPVKDCTRFIRLQCSNRGAFLCRSEAGETIATKKEGEFFTTIHEFDVAIRYGLISNITILECLDCAKSTTFEKFVNPLYANRLTTKGELARLKAEKKETCAAFIDLKKDDIFYKLLLNNGYGKFCQDPTRYKEHYITDPGEQPPYEWWRSVYEIPWPKCDEFKQPLFESDRYWIWCKPSPGFRYNNVGTGASITGAARAVLLEALQHVEDPIYCDTDSIICRGWDARKIHVHKTELGAWDLEDEFSKVILNGKKLYAVWHKEPKRRTPEEIERGMDPRYTVKSKGTADITWQEMLSMIEGKSVAKRNRAPTLTKFGTQNYITRNIRSTAPTRDTFL